MPGFVPLTVAMMLPLPVAFELSITGMLVNEPTETAVAATTAVALALAVVVALIAPVFRTPPTKVVWDVAVPDGEPRTTAVETLLALSVALTIEPRLITLYVPAMPPGSERPPIVMFATVEPPKPGAIISVGEAPVL